MGANLQKKNEITKEFAKKLTKICLFRKYAIPLHQVYEYIVN